MRILVAGGGTGGHIYPTLAVVEELEKHGIKDIMYVGSTEGMETRIIPQFDLNYRFVQAGKFRRYHANPILNLVDPSTLLKNIGDAFKVVGGVFESRKVLKEFKPDIVFVKGGYVGVPIGLAAAWLGYPLMIHESDSAMGLANRILARFAMRVMVSYPVNHYKDIPRARLVYTGNPVRKEILKGNPQEALKVFGLKEKDPVILVIGGSQGSHFINSLVAESLEELLKKYQIIHVCGDLDFSWLSFQRTQLPEKLKERYKVYSFLSAELKDAYAIADLAISRAGQNVISELCAVGKPMLLIPHGPYGAHQHYNAQILTRFGAAYTLTEDNLSKEDFLTQLSLIFEKPSELEFMAKKSKEFGCANAAETMADIIVRTVKEFDDEHEEKEEIR